MVFGETKRGRRLEGEHSAPSQLLLASTLDVEIAQGLPKNTRYLVVVVAEFEPHVVQAVVLHLVA
jgi:hypothetical protein